MIQLKGYSSKTYLTKVKNRRYIIKKTTFDEFKILLIAYRLNITAKPVFFDKKLSIMAYEYIDGIFKERLSFKEIKKVANLLKKLHSLKAKKRGFVLCHQDLNPKNFIFEKEPKLIDWEYADFNDRYFDLASFVVEFNLNKKEEKFFLKTYFKNIYEINYKKLSFFKQSYTKLCIKWFKQRGYLKEKAEYQKKLNRRYP